MTRDGFNEVPTDEYKALYVSIWPALMHGCAVKSCRNV